MRAITPLRDAAMPCRRYAHYYSAAAAIDAMLITFIAIIATCCFHFHYYYAIIGAIDTRYSLLIFAPFRYHFQHFAESAIIYLSHYYAIIFAILMISSFFFFIDYHYDMLPRHAALLPRRDYAAFMTALSTLRC